MNEQELAALAGVALGWLGAGATATPEKSQAVRVLDVLVIGPALVALSVSGDLSKSEQFALAFVGGATVGYNARNLFDTARKG